MGQDASGRFLLTVSHTGRGEFAAGKLGVCGARCGSRISERWRSGRV